MSYVIKVQVKGEAGWTGNGLYFPTKEQAENYASDLTGRWTLVDKTKVETDPKPPNYSFIDDKLEAIGG